LNVPDTLLGKSVRCSKCQSVFKAEADVEEVAAVDLPPAGGKRKRERDRDMDDDYDDYDARPRKRRVEYATFSGRFAAAFLDGILLNIVSFPIGFALGMVGESTKQPVLFGIVAQILSILIGWLYFAAMESSQQQATLGKRLLGIKVTDMDGKPVTFLRATGRHFGKLVSAIILLIGYIMAAFTEKKQALHDIMAGCLVVKKSN
jgi:uncharacterized RDD family membrane protein YckC